MILALLVGLVFAFLGSMPIAGPIAVIVVSKGLENKGRTGLFIATGAAIAESGYAFMAFWGLTSLLHRYPLVLPASRVFGSTLLIALGLFFILRKRKEPARTREPEPERAPFKDFLFGFSVTAANPTLIVTWTAAVGAAQSTGLLRVHAFDALPFAGGVASGIIGWFALLLWLLSHFRTKVNPKTIDRLIRGMGALLVVLGAGLALRAISEWRGGR